MTNMRTFGKTRIAVSPFPNREIVSVVKNGYRDIQQNTDLTMLQVVYPYSDSETNLYIAAGCSVWVKGDLAKTNHARIYSTKEGEKQFILLPFSEVILYDDFPKCET